MFQFHVMWTQLQVYRTQAILIMFYVNPGMSYHSDDSKILIYRGIWGKVKPTVNRGFRSIVFNLYLIIKSENGGKKLLR